MGRKPQSLAVREAEQKALAKPERLFHEINLLHLEGHYFTFDPKAARITRDPLKELDERFRKPELNTTEPVSITPHPSYGMPSVFSYKVFQAVLKKLSDYGYPAPESVSFGHREIMRLIGRDSYGGKDSKELIKVLNQFRHTAINCWMYNRATKESANLSFSLATTYLYTYNSRRQMTLFTVYLHPFIIKSINDQYTFCLNFARMEKLEPISTALYKHLYFHFSNIYSQKQSKDFFFRKDYGEVCRMWLGGLKVLRYKSDILKDQLGRHLDALKKTKLIHGYEIEKNAHNDGFNLIFYPGAGFFEDYDRFYNRNFQTELPFVLSIDENTIQHPQEIVLYFYKKLYGEEEVGGFALGEKETAFAASLLEKQSVDEVKRFVDYGLTEAAKTNFDIKTFGGLKKYYLPYVKKTSQRTQEAAQEAARMKEAEEERQLRAYRTFRQEQLTAIRSAVPPEDLALLEDRARAEIEAEHPGVNVLSAWLQQRTDRVLAEQHGVLSFTEWQKQVVDKVRGLTRVSAGSDPNPGADAMRN